VVIDSDAIAGTQQMMLLFTRSRLLVGGALEQAAQSNHAI